MQTGSILPLFPGDKLSSFSPSRSNTAYANFIGSIHKQLAPGFNLPNSFVLRDFENGSYSSLKMGFNAASKSVATARTWLKQFLNTLYEMLLEEATDRGFIDAPNFYRFKRAWSRVDWVFDGQGWLDPVREAQAAQLRMTIGISTLRDECAEQGKDWEEVLEPRAAEQQKMAALGLDMATLQTLVSVAPQIPVETSDQQDQREQQAAS